MIRSAYLSFPLHVTVKNTKGRGRQGTCVFQRYPRDEDNRKRFIAHCIRYGAAEPRAKQSQGVVRGRVEGGDPEDEGRRNDVRARRQ